MYIQEAYAASGYQAAATQTTSSNSMGSSDFMLLLLTEMRNQNPLEPMDNTEMMSQFTQMNSLSELQTIKSNLEGLQQISLYGFSASLIGKTVTAKTGVDNAEVKGTVTGVDIDSGVIYLRIGEKKVPLADVIKFEQEEANG